MTKASITLAAGLLPQNVGPVDRVLRGIVAATNTPRVERDAPHVAQERWPSSALGETEALHEALLDAGVEGLGLGEAGADTLDHIAECAAKLRAPVAALNMGLDLLHLFRLQVPVDIVAEMGQDLHAPKPSDQPLFRQAHGGLPPYRLEAPQRGVTGRGATGSSPQRR